MSKAVCANILICQQVIQDKKDDVFSAIRLVDLFWMEDDPSPADRASVVEIQTLTEVKFLEEDAGAHAVKLSLIRPSGTSVVLLQEVVEISRSKADGAPCGYTIMGALPVAYRETGTHYLVLECDGEERARAPFTFARRSERTSL